MSFDLGSEPTENVQDRFTLLPNQHIVGVSLHTIESNGGATFGIQFKLL